jgi:hypothetical protein
VKRFLKIFALFVVGLLALVVGVNSALDHACRSVVQSSFTIYNEQGQALLTYTGDLNNCKALAKPGPALVPRFLHRT